MIELIAGALVAAAALTYVLEPLAHRPIGSPPRDAPADEAEALVRRIRLRLAVTCPRCGLAAEQGAVFCPSCGRMLV